LHFFASAPQVSALQAAAVNPALAPSDGVPAQATNSEQAAPAKRIVTIAFI
jgi:hypothetical protein